MGSKPYKDMHLGTDTFFLIVSTICGSYYTQSENKISGHLELYGQNVFDFDSSAIVSEATPSQLQVSTTTALQGKAGWYQVGEWQFPEFSGLWQ